MSKNNVLAIARAELGNTEVPANSNRTKYGLAYGLDGQPWCAMFLWWIFWMAGESAAFCGGQRVASCGAIKRYYQAQGRWVTGGYQPCDIVILNFSGTQDTEHCGIIETVNTNGTITTIEGNTSPGSEGSQDNGGCVARKQRYLSNVIGAGRPAYSIEMPSDVPTGHWGVDAIRYCLSEGYMVGYPDGSFKPDTPITRAELASILFRIFG